MGLYRRRDSPWWWFRIEGTTIRRSTGIATEGASPAQTRDCRAAAEAIYLAAQTKHALAQAGLGPATRPRIGFRAFRQWYETHVVVHQRGAVRAASMLRLLGQHFDRFTDLTHITPLVVREWQTTRRRQVAAATVNREFDTLKALLRAAVPEYLESHPFPDVRRLRQPETEARVLTYDEEARLLAVCSPSDRAFILAGLDTLLRLGSLLALRWDQVKLDRRVIVVLNPKVKTRPKPISLRLLDALRALPRTSPYVFAQFYPRAQESPTIAANLATRRFARLCALADVRHGRACNGVTIHSMRHTGATRALQRGASVRTVMELGGWTLPTTVMRYLHASDGDVAAAAESIGQSRAETAAQSRDGHVPANPTMAHNGPQAARTAAPRSTRLRRA